MVQNLKNEIWLPVKDYESYYAVSNLGRVKAFSREWASGKNGCTIRKKDEILICQNDCKGYNRIVLTKNGKQKSITVHRVMANTFIPNIDNLPCINHKNGIKKDNRIENLEWCTVQYNTIHSYENGLQVSQKRGTHSQARKVKCDTLDMTFDCIRDAGDCLGVDWTTVWHICRGDRVESKGLNFRYI